MFCRGRPTVCPEQLIMYKGAHIGAPLREFPLTPERDTRYNFEGDGWNYIKGLSHFPILTKKPENVDSIYHGYRKNI